MRKTKPKNETVNNKKRNLSSEDDTEKSSEEEERIKVFVRIRPFSLTEKKIDDSSPIESIDKEENCLVCK